MPRRVATPENAKDSMSDEAFELMCILPIEPYYITREEIAEELGYDNEMIKRCNDEMRVAGIRPVTNWHTTTSNGKKINASRYCIDERYWDRAQKLGNEYWAKRDKTDGN